MPAMPDQQISRSIPLLGFGYQVRKICCSLQEDGSRFEGAREKRRISATSQEC